MNRKFYIFSSWGEKMITFYLYDLGFFSPCGSMVRRKSSPPLIYVASAGHCNKGSGVRNQQESRKTSAPFRCEGCFIIKLLLSTHFLSNGRKMSLQWFCRPYHGTWFLLLLVGGSWPLQTM